MSRLAILATHPIQYYAPWFRHLARTDELDVRVFYLWDFGVAGRRDPGFQSELVWDVPLLDGYAHEFVPNAARDPGTHRFAGLVNPDLLARVARWRPDAVLLTAYRHRSLVDFLACWSRRRAPILFRGDSHRLVPRPGIAEPLRRAAITMLFRRFDACLAVGHANRDYFRHHGVPSRRIFFSPHAVDNARFMDAEPDARRAAVAWRHELGIPDEHRVLLFAGKFVEKKRPLDLLAAFRRARLDAVTLLFVGSGPLESDLRRAAAGVPAVVFAPFQNQSLMPRTLAAADLLALPSFGPFETWGLVVNEAMCMGVPALVSTHVGCARDLVVPGRTGFVFRAGDVAELSARLREAFADPRALARLGRNARRRVARYDYAHATQGLLHALDATGVNHR